MTNLSLTTLLLTLSSIILRLQNNYNRIASRQQWDPTYDYIVVGAGSAGSVVAARLSEIAKNRVLLLEVGIEETIVSTMPSMSDSLKNTRMDWNYTIAPQKYSCIGLTDRLMKWPRGRVLGGSSAINRMVHLRGNPKDYDNWANSGADGWQWSKVFPYFLKLENETDPDLAKNGYHSTSGPLTISSMQDVDQLTKQWVIASNATGYPIIDLNGKQRRGTAVPQRTVRNGVRQSSSDAYLAPNYDRKNLHILTNTLVTKILFDSNKTAIGVEFIRNGNKYSVNAIKEVIVSSGSINSPQLLMLSGIGPKKHLQDLKIDVISDLPVGDNLHDHPRVYGVHFLTNFTFTERSPTLDSLSKYFINGSGPLSQSDYSVTFFQSSYVKQTDWPDVQLGLMQSSPANIASSGKATGIKDEIWHQFYGPYQNRSQFSISVILLRPKSRGTLRLGFNDPNHKPVLNPNYFSEAQDVETIAEGMAEAYRIAMSESLKSFGVEVYRTLVNGCERFHNSDFTSPSKEYLKCVARTLTSSAAHITGTCKMGAKTDQSAVVDPELRVKGVSSLRVIDASVMPSVVSANINAATVMIGEYGAQLVLSSRHRS